MLYDIFRPTGLKITLATFIFIVFTTTFTLNLVNKPVKKSTLPATIKKLTATDYIKITGVILFLPISWLAPHVNQITYNLQLSLPLAAGVSVITYTLAYYALFSLLFYLIIKWYQSDS